MKKNDDALIEPGMTRVTRLRVEDALSIAVGLHRDGLLDEAAEMYSKVLEAEPDQPDAVHFLGVLRHQMGDSGEAVRLISKVLDRLPEHVAAWNNLGNVYKEMGNEPEAEAAYRRVLALAADHPDANCNLAVLLRTRGDIAAAYEHLDTALATDPGHPDALYNLSMVLQDLGRFDEAAAAARKALESGRRPDAYENVATSLCKAGRLHEAIEIVRQWLARDPGDPVATHLLAAYLNENTPDRASDAYVIKTFDEFAPSFDVVLGKIDYQAPRLVSVALAAALTDTQPVAEILDAGCGTGLCGPLLRDSAKRLVGVDLSGPMLVKARERGCYDALVEGELTAHLRTLDANVDVIVSADTLVYFGRLDEALDAAQRALSPDGLIVFTVEALKEGNTKAKGGYFLQPNGRYLHARDYVERCLADAGFDEVVVDEAILRKELGKPVEGLVFRARKRSAQAASRG